MWKPKISPVKSLDLEAEEQTVVIPSRKERFDDEQEESLYQEYVVQGQKKNLLLLCTLSILHAGLFILLSFCIVEGQHNHPWSTALLLCALAALCVAVAFITVCCCPSTTSPMHHLMPLLFWALLLLQFNWVCLFWFDTFTHASHQGDSAVWQHFFVFLPYAVFPSLKLRLCVVLSFVSIVVGITVNASISKLTYHKEQLIADLFLSTVAAILGVFFYLSNDHKRRKAYREIKGSLSVKTMVEDKYKEQKRLLLSVLPKYIADDMLNDDKDCSPAHSQFRKIFVNRHEHVSILFADIVGFTAISSQCSAAELVAVINELFATFDKLAELYRQLRIKLLGDCYYCVSGVPKARPDHAVLCVHMGLSMVMAIKKIQQKLNSEVNMRVGIHSGGVLAGVLGQHRWQFDILGKHVTSANRMESAGLPGKVHISEGTASYLNDEFELEEHVEIDPEFARKLGMKTYFVKSILKRFPEGTLLDEVPITNFLSGFELTSTIRQKEESLMRTRRLTRSSQEIRAISAPGSIQLDETSVSSDASFATDYGELRDALLDTAEPIAAKSFNRWTLSFNDHALERSYVRQRAVQLKVPVTIVMLILPMVFASMASELNFALFGVFVAFEGLFIGIYALFFNKWILLKSEAVAKVSSLVKRIPYLGHLVSLLTLSAYSAFLLANMGFCDTDWSSKFNSSNSTGQRLPPPSFTFCRHLNYHSSVVVVFLLGVTFMVQEGHLVRIASLLYILVLYLILAAFKADLFLALDYQIATLFNISTTMEHTHPTLFENVVLTHSNVTIAAMLAIVTFVLSIFNRSHEMASRKRYLYKHGVEKQHRQFEALRQRNDSLLTNILPSHVAKEFLGKDKDDTELYSHYYSDVGVMFAACPNFNEFYNESDVNNSGLECIRLLNEIISDYDDILLKPQYKNIVKIKTSGSTYMVASGLDTTTKEQQQSNEKTRWRHLSKLVDFAFAICDCLERINKDSFNNFKLRIGIAHGPVVAGVIGARKPHYDIWGHTVNLASRMESTGVIGSIQVPDVTGKILADCGHVVEERGRVRVKGKGHMVTYFVRKPKS